MKSLIETLADLWKVIDELNEAVDGLNQELENFETKSKKGGEDEEA